MNHRVSAFALALIAATSFAQSASYEAALVSDTQNVANLLLSGPSSAQTLQVVFDTANLSSSLAASYQATGGNFHIVAILPDGSVYSFTRAGWIRSNTNDLPIAFSRKSSIFDVPPPETIVDGIDTSALAGTAVYAGIGVGRTLTYSYLGSLLPPRPVTPTKFPFYSGSWQVSRIVDRFTDAVTCSLTTSPKTPDGFYVIRFGWDKISRGEPITMGMGLYGARTGNFLFSAHPGNSLLRVDQHSTFTLNRKTGAAYYLLPGTTTVAGPQALYGNFEPNISQMMAGSSLGIWFVSRAGSTTYTVDVDLAGISAAVDSFEYCISTQ